MALSTDDFEAPYDLDSPPGSQPPPADSPLSSPQATTTPAIPSTSPPWWSPANLLPGSLGQWVNYEAPTWSDLGRGIENRAGYVLGRGELGLAEAGNWAHQRTDPQTGQTYWLDPVSGNRLNSPPFATPAMVRPDLPTGVAGSVAESVTRNPFLGLLAPGATVAGAATNELMQGFPAWERNIVGGLVGLGAGGGFRDIAHGVGSLAHGTGELFAGHPFRAIHTLSGIPGVVSRFIRDPRAWGKSIISGHVAGVDQPPSEPGRVNELQRQSQQEH